MVVFQNCVLVKISISEIRISEIRISEIRVIQGIGYVVVTNYLIITLVYKLTCGCRWLVSYCQLNKAERNSIHLMAMPT